MLNCISSIDTLVDILMKQEVWRVHLEKWRQTLYLKKLTSLFAPLWTLVSCPGLNFTFTLSCVGGGESMLGIGQRLLFSTFSRAINSKA